MNRGHEHGFATVQYVAITALSLVVLVLVANVLVGLYARAAVREALDEGARAGAVAGGGEAECRARAEEVLATLLRGTVADGIRVECLVEEPWVEARARAVMRSWLPDVVPDWAFEVRAVALREP